MNTRGQSTSAVILFLLLAAASLLFLMSGVGLTTPLLALIGVFVFFIAFFNTDLALVILIFSMLLSPELRAGAISGRSVVIRGEDILLLIIVAGWLAKMAVNKELGLMRSTRLNVPIYFYILICLLSTMISIAQGFARPSSSVFHLLKYFEYFLLFFMVVNNLKDMKQAKKYIIFVLLTCFVVCVWSVKNIGDVPRLTAPFEGKEGEPNTFAGYLLIMMALTLGLMVHLSNLRARLGLLAVFAVSLLSFVYTLSRGGWLAFFPMFLTITILGRKWKFSLLIVLIIVLIALPSLLPQRAQERIRQTFVDEKTYTVFGKEITLSESASARIETWKDAFFRLKFKPFFGFGVPSANLVDSQYTRVLGELGLIGFTIFCWLLFRIYRTALRVYHEVAHHEFAEGVALGFLAGFIGLLIHSFSAASFIIIRIMEPFWFLAGIVVMLPVLIEEECAPSGLQRRP